VKGASDDSGPLCLPKLSTQRAAQNALKHGKPGWMTDEYQFMRTLNPLCRNRAP